MIYAQACESASRLDLVAVISRARWFPNLAKSLFGCACDRELSNFSQGLFGFAVLLIEHISDLLSTTFIFDFIYL